MSMSGSTFTDCLPGLLSRLEAAGEGSRELDWLVECHLRGVDPERSLRHGAVDDYTTSLDAALTLVPDGSPVEMQIRPGQKSMADIGVWYDEETPYYSVAKMVWAATPALALCIAALRAREG